MAIKFSCTVISVRKIKSLTKFPGTETFKLPRSFVLLVFMSNKWPTCAICPDVNCTHVHGSVTHDLGPRTRNPADSVSPDLTSAFL